MQCFCIVARAATGRDKVAFSGYHGWCDWYLAANLGENDALDGQLMPGLEPAGVPRGLKGTALPFHYNRLEELEAIVSECGDELAAIIMEPERGVAPEPGFLESVRRIASSTGAVLIYDEITSGFRMNTAKQIVRPPAGVWPRLWSGGERVKKIFQNEKYCVILSEAVNSYYFKRR